MPLPVSFPRALFAGILASIAIALSGCSGPMRAYNTHHALYKAPLAPYVQACMQPRSLIGREGLEDIQASPAVSAHHRPLPVADVADSVSVETGHRLLYRYKGTRYLFANVKIERSMADSYARDKEVIGRQYRRIAEIESVLYAHTTRNGLEVHSVESDSLVGGTLGMHAVFADEPRLIVTAYFFDQGPGGSQRIKNRPFRTFGEYVALRDRFLDDLTACVTAAADSLTR